MTGCIPVIIADHIRLPFDTMLDWRQFSVKVRRASRARVLPAAHARMAPASAAV